MALTTHKAPSGFLLPSIHSAPPFFTQQPNPITQGTLIDHWIKLILAYARYRKLFILQLEDADTSDGEWAEVLRNERINRRLLPSHLSAIFDAMVQRNVAAYEPNKQAGAVLVYWRSPEEWAEALHRWVTDTGQLGTIMTYYEIIDPPVESPLSNLPIPLLKKAISILAKAGRAQIITMTDGDGVRFFGGNK